MANWSETRIKFHGKKEAIERFEKFLRSEAGDDGNFPIAEMEIDNFDGVLSVSGTCRWSLETEKLAEYCKRFGVDASGYDAEPGCDFFNEFFIEDGQITEEIYEYFCEQSVEAMGAQYFVDFFGESCSTKDEAEKVYEKMTDLGVIEPEEDKLEWLRYISAFEWPSDKEIAIAKAKLDKLPGFNEAREKTLALKYKIGVYLDEYIYIVEAKKVEDNHYDVLALYNGEWIENKIAFEQFARIAKAEDVEIETGGQNAA